MGQRTDRNDVHSRFCNAGDGVVGYAARGFGKGAAVYQLDRFFHCIVVHIVEHNYVGFCAQGLLNLVEVAGLDLYFNGVAYFFS